MPFWFAPESDVPTGGRLNLDFGMRSSDLFFRERVVPGIGGAWFVRQLSWACAALALHAKQGVRRGPRATDIAHAIEALGSKRAWWAEEESNRINGVRAFQRDEDDFSFATLSRRKNYVQVTHRQGAVRALRGEPSLGLAVGGRFDGLALLPPGQDLADAFLYQPVGKGGAALEGKLLAWIAGADVGEAPSLVNALSPSRPSKAEYEVVRRRLCGLTDPAGTTRARLAKIVDVPKLPDLDKVLPEALAAAGWVGQAADIVAARAFGALLDRTREFAGALTPLVEQQGGSAKVAELAKADAVASAARQLRVAATAFLTRAGLAGVVEPISQDFARQIHEAKDDSHLTAVVVSQPNTLLGLDGAMLRRGPLFRVLIGADAAVGEASGEPPDPLASDRTFRISNLHSLLRDVPVSG